MLNFYHRTVVPGAVSRALYMKMLVSRDMNTDAQAVTAVKIPRFLPLVPNVLILDSSNRVRGGGGGGGGGGSSSNSSSSSSRCGGGYNENGFNSGNEGKSERAHVGDTKRVKSETVWGVRDESETVWGVREDLQGVRDSLDSVLQLTMHDCGLRLVPAATVVNALREYIDNDSLISSSSSSSSSSRSSSSSSSSSSSRGGVVGDPVDVPTRFPLSLCAVLSGYMTKSRPEMVVATYLMAYSHCSINCSRSTDERTADASISSLSLSCNKVDLQACPRPLAIFLSALTTLQKQQQVPLVRTTRLRTNTESQVLHMDASAVDVLGTQLALEEVGSVPLRDLFLFVREIVLRRSARWGMKRSGNELWTQHLQGMGQQGEGKYPQMKPPTQLLDEAAILGWSAMELANSMNDFHLATTIWRAVQRAVTSRSLGSRINQNSRVAHAAAISKVTHAYLRSFKTYSQHVRARERLLKTVGEELPRLVSQPVSRTYRYTNYATEGQLEQGRIDGSTDARTHDEILNAFLRVGGLASALSALALPSVDRFAPKRAMPSKSILLNMVIYYDKQFRDYNSLLRQESPRENKSKSDVNRNFEMINNGTGILAESLENDASSDTQMNVLTDEWEWECETAASAASDALPWNAYDSAEACTKELTRLIKLQDNCSLFSELELPSDIDYSLMVPNIESTATMSLQSYVCPAEKLTKDLFADISMWATLIATAVSRGDFCIIIFVVIILQNLTRRP